MTRDEYIEELYVEDPKLSLVQEIITKNNMPKISVAPMLGRMLTLLAHSINARRALEIGSLGGYSAICIAQALPSDGQLICLEHNPNFVQVAKNNIQEAALIDRVTFMAGEAVNNLIQLVNDKVQFDMVFIDADKMNYPIYLSHAVSLSHPGTLIIADNVLLKDRVCDPLATAPSPIAMRQFNETFASHPKFESVILPIYDGFGIARVR